MRIISDYNYRDEFWADVYGCLDELIAGRNAMIKALLVDVIAKAESARRQGVMISDTSIKCRPDILCCARP